VKWGQVKVQWKVALLMKRGIIWLKNTSYNNPFLVVSNFRNLSRDTTSEDRLPWL
jgi:hypothetical protein